MSEVYADNLPADIAARATAAARHIADALAYVGVLCVEFFVIHDETGALDLRVNEMAPRPHNSGHWSMDGSSLCQFELQVRTSMGWPLATPITHGATVMLNVLGDIWFTNPSAKAQEPDWASVLQLAGVHLHLYGKSEPRMGRKMGHINCRASDIATARATAARVAQHLRILGTGLLT